MRLRLFLQSLLFTGWFALLLITPALSKEVKITEVETENAQEKTSNQAINAPITKIPRLNQIDFGFKSVQWLVQSPPPSSSPAAEIIEVTGVQVNRTQKGLDIIFQTTKGEQLQGSGRNEGNAYIADIPNAQLRLPSGNTFRQEKPITGITEVTVTNQDANTIRVTVTGEAGVPTVELFDSDEGLIFEVAAPAPSVPQPEQQPQTPTPAPAQPESQIQPEQPSAETEEPIELLVTGEQDSYSVPDATAGTRTDTPIRDIPFSIQVVPEQVLEDRKVQRVTDALRTVAGVTTQDSPVSVFESFNFRGFSSQSFLRNGLRDETSGTAGSGIANIERIEVLKGPAGALFGQGSPGGTINIVTKQPLSSPFYEIEGTIGSFDTYEGIVDLTGPVNTDNETLLYRLTASASKLGSFIDFVENERYLISPVLTWLIDKNTNLSLEAEYLSTKNPNYNGLPAVGTVLSNPEGEIPRDRNLNEPSFDKNDRQVLRIGYNFEHRFSENWQIRNSFRAAFQEYQNEAIFPSELLEDNRTLERTAQSLESTRNFYLLDTNIVGDFNTGSIAHKLLFGFDLLRDDTRNRDTQDFAIDPIDLFNPVYGSQTIGSATESSNFITNTDGLGIYLQDQIALAENFKVLLGGRFDIASQEQEDDNDDTISFLQDEAFSPRLGLVYQPNQNISLYASYSRSFTQVTGTSFDNQLFEPERGTQYELGIKGDWLDGNLSTTLAFYQITRSNVLSNDPDNSGFSIQTGEQRSRGIELDIAGEILPGWQIIGGYAYTDALVTEDEIFEGNQINNAPEHAFSLWTTYEIQSGNLQGLGFGLGLYYIGERQGDLDNTFELPSYFRTDAALYYRRNDFRVALNVNNLFDVEYFESAFDSLSVIPSSPLTVELTLGWQF
jgi:iron complex outermembrane receptor protein